MRYTMISCSCLSGMVDSIRGEIPETLLKLVTLLLKDEAFS